MSIGHWKICIHSVAHAPIKIVLKIFEISESIKVIQRSLHTEVDISLLRLSGFLRRQVCGIDTSLVEQNGIKIMDRVMTYVWNMKHVTRILRVCLNNCVCHLIVLFQRLGSILVLDNLGSHQSQKEDRNNISQQHDLHQGTRSKYI